MTTLTWDQVGDRLFETGLDRGVLYRTDRTGIAWNGLRSVVENASPRTLTPLYHDGVKYSDAQITGDFVGTITALTYPDEFLLYEGNAEDSDGFLLKNQPLNRFHLSYRTLIGNDIESIDFGYKIHILYNLLAVPKDLNNQTLSNSATPMEFGWTISSVPEIISGYRPTSHVVFDSRKLDPYFLTDLELLLYGNPIGDATLPTLTELKSFIDGWSADSITIIDNGDGTWTAVGSPEYIHILDETTVEIEHGNTTVIDSDSYTISSGLDI